MKQISKQAYIKAFQAFLKERDGNIQKLDLDTITTHTIWKNTSKDGGMRLTMFGWQLLTEHIALESWKFEIDENHCMSGKLYLLLDRHIDCPYYIMNRNVHIFNSKLATAIAIQGPITKFINVRETNSKNKSN